MFTSIGSFFDSEGFMPHGMCLLWRPDILWAHVVADAIIALAYFSIPAAIIYFARRRRNFPYVWVLYLFGAFIVWCGITHVASIWTFWVPAYGAQAAVKVVTAAVSMTTAIMLWPLMPKALRIPGVGELQEKNVQLEREIADRVLAERQLHELTVSLEHRVAERTQELTNANTHLKDEIERRRRGEEQLRKAKAEAEGANRSKAIFLAGMSHELRSPLNAILGFAAMLDQIYPQGLDERQRKYVKNIETSGTLLLDLIERLLDLSMAESGHVDVRLEPVNVAACLRKAHTVLAPMALQSDVVLSLAEPEGESLVVMADPTRLSQIIVNLGTNAIKYNRPGGRVDISVRIEADTVAIRIADTGVGIPADLHPQVFQPFNRLNQYRSGTHGAGIGLALSKRLAEAMGAGLIFKSIEGQGSVFELLFPLAAGR